MSEISKLVSAILKLFRDLVNIADTLSPNTLREIQSHLSKYKLWAGSLGAHRPHGHRSLEYRLSEAPGIRNHVVELLQSLRDLLGEAISSAQQSSSPSSQVVPTICDADDEDLIAYFEDDEDFVTDDFQRLLAQIKSNVDRLMRLSFTIRNPAPYEQFNIQEPTLVSSFMTQYTNHIQEKFPGIHIAIRERLGKGLAHRRLFFRYREGHHLRLSAGLNEEDQANESVGGGTTEASWKPRDEVETRSSELKDDISEWSATSYALSSADSGELRVPDMPPGYMDGPVLCPYCWLPIEVKDRYHWKQHVFTDLRPYICLAESCSSSIQEFERRNEWCRHMVEHCRVWTCPFGCSNTFRTAAAYRSHLIEGHRLPTPSDRIDMLVNTESKIDLHQMEGKCLLCQEVEIRKPREYQSHVGNHLEQLALFVLPNIYESQGDEDETGKSMEKEKSEEESILDEGRIDLAEASSGTPSTDTCVNAGCTESRIGGPMNIPQCRLHWTADRPRPLDDSSKDGPGSARMEGRRRQVMETWTCSRCGDGTNILPTNPQCINCGHSRCDYCQVHTDILGLSVPTGPTDKDH